MRHELRPRGLVRSPVAQFLGVGLLLFLGVALVGARLTDGAAEQEALDDARSTTYVLAHSVVEPSLVPALVGGDPGAIDRFDREVLDRLLVDDVRRVKIWAGDGTIVWSDQTELVGERYALDEEELEILREGGTDAELSDLADPENRLETGVGGLVEVYTRVETPDGTPLLFEAYYSTTDIEADTQEVIGPFRRIMLGSLLVLGALATLMIWALSRRLRRAAAERQRLLQVAIDASEAERRRIARDLHDGVVQDLAGTAFALSAAARGPEPVTTATATEAAGSLRVALRALRSLLVEIHPPDLDADGLAAALEDLVAPAAASGLEATVSVTAVDDASDRAVRLVWRVAQEAVRNAVRHSRGTRLDVAVVREGPGLVLEVTDDGVGMDRTAPVGAGHFGLRGMADLVRDEGGSLDVTSAPGQGTVVRVEVRA